MSCVTSAQRILSKMRPRTFQALFTRAGCFRAEGRLAEAVDDFATARGSNGNVPFSSPVDTYGRCTLGGLQIRCNSR